jgi:hypothetical protein
VKLTTHLNLIFFVVIINIIIIIIIIIISRSAAQRGLWPSRSRGFVITHNHAPHSARILRTGDQLAAETSTWKHTQQTIIHAPDGIRNHDRSRRAALDLDLKPSDHWDRHVYCYLKCIVYGKLLKPRQLFRITLYSIVSIKWIITLSILLPLLVPTNLHKGELRYILWNPAAHK